MFPLNRTHPPFLDLAVNLLIQVADRAGTDFRAPQRLRDAFHAPDRHPGQIHLDQRLLNAAFLPSIPFDDLRFKRQSSKPGYLQFHLAGFRQELPLVRPRSRVETVWAAFIPGRVADRIRLSIQELVQDFLDRLPDELVHVLLNFLFVDFDRADD